MLPKVFERSRVLTSSTLTSIVPRMSRLQFKFPKDDTQVTLLRYLDRNGILDFHKTNSHRKTQLR